MILHFFVLYKAGYPVQTAVFDSLLSNVSLGGAALVVMLSLRYYRPSQNIYGYVVSLCAALSFLWLSVTKALLGLFLHGGSDYNKFFSQSLFIRGATGFLIIVCMALISIVYYTLQDQAEADKRRNEAAALAKEAELNNLRQQLQPHFLFNSLNSINALVVSQPHKARTMIQQLSEFLRGTLKQEQKEWIDLEEELQHLQLYLEIEKVRFGHRLSTAIKNETAEAKLPLMLLQPVVENAIKFGLYDTTEAITITIKATQAAGYLILEITNPFDAETSSPKKGTGFGLSSVQRRLYLLFARTDLLQTTVQQNLFITTVKIPQA